MNICTPVLLIFFKREREALQVLDAIRKCAPKKMYIASDGGRTEKEHNRILELREKIKACIDWDCQLECMFSDDNRGCGWGPISAINWVFEKEDRCIILEDDCVPDPTFFEYCDQLLERYADNESIWMISGENYVKDKSMFEKADYSFSLKTYTWGWATWKRAWQKCDFNLRLWSVYKKENVLSHTCYMKYYNELEYLTQQLDNIHKQRDKSIWDYQWRFHMIINNGLCIVPRNHLVTNIGWGKNATHTKVKNTIYDVPIEGLSQPLRHPSCVVANADFDKKFGELLFNKELKSQIKNRNWYSAASLLWKYYFG